MSFSGKSSAVILSTFISSGPNSVSPLSVRARDKTRHIALLRFTEDASSIPQSRSGYREAVKPVAGPKPQGTPRSRAILVWKE
jgi:hypothetical protein